MKLVGSLLRFVLKGHLSRAWHSVGVNSYFFNLTFYVVVRLMKKVSLKARISSEVAEICYDAFKSYCLSSCHTFGNAMNKKANGPLARHS